MWQKYRGHDNDYGKFSLMCNFQDAIAVLYIKYFKNAFNIHLFLSLIIL